jgi:hypothetical protein
MLCKAYNVVKFLTGKLLHDLILLIWGHLRVNQSV